MYHVPRKTNNQNERTGSTDVGELVQNGIFKGTGSMEPTSDTIRWEITDVNQRKGTFTLLIRSGLVDIT